jgi:hypothetical protein
MLWISESLLDRRELERWIARLGLEHEWQLAQEYQEP